ncbi:short-chain dehydrogenase [Spirochaeta lutea]|uniref:Short-chain dehydrogenase n=1 Tax=Spirochaeta lutea TaxID=1480694 RepID=A0A098QWK7_9SPIO|nr:short-chain dehydrogenase [Spirochaeta lutea]
MTTGKTSRSGNKPAVLITGVSRKIGIGYALARTLARAGWNIGFTYYRDYDEQMPWGSRPEDVEDLIQELKGYGAAVCSQPADLADPEEPRRVIREVRDNLGPLSALVMSHCYSVDSTIQDTSLESFERHFRVNTRATWLLIREFSRLFAGTFGTGRIVAITSDHTAGNMPYGASKGAMDRIVLAAAQENRSRGITANVINPGATDTGWMTPALEQQIRRNTFLNRIGTPQDCANLVEFLCSDRGCWINGQVLYSNGGVEPGAGG